jgi:FixJ family two-component response regulator
MTTGAVGFFFKPIDHVELLLTVEKVLGGAASASQS